MIPEFSKKQENAADQPGTSGSQDHDESPPRTSSDDQANTSSDDVSRTVDEAVRELCREYAELYCETPEDTQLSFEELAEDEQEWVTDDCHDRLSRAHDEQRSAFAACVGEIVDCDDTTSCLMPLPRS